MKTIRGDQNVFIYGLTGSGKDTLLSIIKSNECDYLYLRLADTLKHIVTESRLESHHELEVSKRESDDIRKLHNDIDLLLRPVYLQPEMGEQGIGYNRAKMIMKRKTWEFTNPIIDNDFMNNALSNYPILISDVREKEVIKMLLEDGWYGIFIDNIFGHVEYRDINHVTEYDLFKDKNELKKLVELHGKNMTLFCNNTTDMQLETRTKTYIPPTMDRLGIIDSFVKYINSISYLKDESK